MRPPYITATRCATSATTPRSWVIRITAAPVSAWRRASTRQHLRLHGDVERGGRLVGDDQLRPPGHRHGDDRALAHAAGELVRDTAARGRPGRRCRPRAAARPRARRRSRAGEAAVRDLALGDLAADRQDRVQRRGRVLEDEADVAGRASAAASSASAPMTSMPPRRIEPRRARSSGSRPEIGERGDALARAGLADDAEHLVRRRRRSRCRAPPAPVGPTPTNVTSRPRTEQDRVRRQARSPFDAGAPAACARRQGLNPIVRATSMLSMSSVKPPTFLAATIRPMS